MKRHKSEFMPLSTVSGIVKWFDPARGFGFIEVEGLEPDVLLHHSDLQNFGRSSVTPGSTVEFIIFQSRRGLQVRDIVDIVPSSLEVAQGIQTTSERELVPARVKWFDDAKGFGFVNVFGEEDDCFLHRSVLKSAGLSSANTGEAICVAVAQSGEGLVAVRAGTW